MVAQQQQQQQQLWVVRMNPQGHDLVPQGQQQGLLLTGWSETTKLTGLMDYEYFRDQIVQTYFSGATRPYSRSITNNVVGAWRILHKMGIGDLFIVPHGRDVYVCCVAGPAYHDPAGMQNDSAHRRVARWCLGPIQRRGLSDALRATLRFPGTCCSANQHVPEINALLQLHGVAPC